MSAPVPYTDSAAAKVYMQSVFDAMKANKEVLGFPKIMATCKALCHHRLDSRKLSVTPSISVTLC